MNNKRKLLVSVFVVLLLAGVISFVGTDTLFCLSVTYEGNGTNANPYKVSNVEQLQCIEEDLHASYMLVSDINASETSEWNGGKGFEPIGEWVGDDSTSALYSSYNSFTGTLNGRGHNITNLTIDRGDNAGLFSIVGGGVVTNVSVVDADITGSRYVGGLVGLNDGRINESYATGKIKGNEFVGGLVGENYGGKIENSYATVSVDGDEYVGGIVGWNQGTVEESYATRAVSGDSLVGGLVGGNRYIIKNSYATGTVEGNENVGGLVGSNSDGGISESYATGKIKGDEYVGGLVGNNDGTVRGSYATGSVDGSEKVGSLVGSNAVGDISESYATGKLEGSEWVGGLVGSNEAAEKQSYWVVEESYWDMNTTGQSTSAGGTGLTTSEITGSAVRTNMRGFDFNNTWVTKPNDYPVLAWEQER